MIEVINSPNGKLVLDVVLFSAACATSIVLYGMYRGYNPSINIGNVHLSLTKSK